MKKGSIHRQSTIVISLIAVSIFILTRCTGNKKQDRKDGGNEIAGLFAGSNSCISCHKDIYNSHIASAHYQTSRPATETVVLGSFEPGKNRYIYNPKADVRMEKREGGLFQVAYVREKEYLKQRMDIAFGSGVKGQSYLHWNGNQLSQLPVTYFPPAKQWANSPGFPAKPAFNRPITSRCMECHVTYANKISEEDKEPEEFDHNGIVYGIDCEKCHGPAAKHVAFQQQNPMEKTAKFIVNPARFTRQQSLDMCALCHGGRLTKTKPSFTFEAGDKLSDYFTYDTVRANVVNIDVHGNQYGLLAASKCFTMSQMTCGSCHSPHAKERDQLTVFTQRCMNCHNEHEGKVCSLKGQSHAILTENCIDCHMPKEPSRSIAVQLQGADVPTPARMRTHFIKIYPGEADKILAFLKERIKE